MRDLDFLGRMAEDLERAKRINEERKSFPPVVVHFPDHDSARIVWSLDDFAKKFGPEEGSKIGPGHAVIYAPESGSPPLLPPHASAYDLPARGTIAADLAAVRQALAQLGRDMLQTVEPVIRRILNLTKER